MFVVSVTFTAIPGKAESFEKLLLKQAQNSVENEEDCLRFDIARREDDPQQFFLYEIYRDAEAFAKHLETQHFLSFNQQAGPMVSSKQVQTWRLCQTA
jgi:(4S)-4-hydroxy-5-phosphonooxypentane-2,3-dione isomerase